jgi:16S rRNA G966 N2-methylase RsmD
MTYKITMRKPSELVPYAKNSRTHSAEQVKQVMRSIEEFGFTNPILTHGKTIIAGHCRLEAAKKLGYTEVPTIALDGLTKEQARAYVIADNKLALNAGWDDGILKDEIESLISVDYAIDLLGFTDEELKDLGVGVEEPEKHSGDPDEVPEVPQNIHGVKRGDVWQLGDHRLMCGDSTSADDVARLMDGEKADMVFTDPPYQLDIEDVNCALILSKVSHIVLICTFKQAAELYSLRSFDFRFDFVINAHIPKSFMNQKQPYYTHQTGVYFSEKDADTIFDCNNAIGVRSEKAYWHTIIDAPRNTQDKHGHAKNIQGLIDVLSGFTAKTVIDMFSGSGSTLIACEKTGRRCYGMELDEHYCSVIIERWQQFTNKKAIRLEGE